MVLKADFDIRYPFSFYCFIFNYINDSFEQIFYINVNKLFYFNEEEHFEVYVNVSDF